MSKQSYHHHNLKEEAIQESIRFIEKFGADLLSLRKLAKTLGVNHAALYHHFQSKEDILVEVSTRCFHEFVESAKKENLKYIGDPKKQFINYGHMYIHYAIENRNIFKLIFSNKRFDTNKYTQWKEVAGSGMVYLLEVIENCQKAGIMKNGPAFEISLALWSSVHGLATLMVDDRLDMLSDFGFKEGFTQDKIIDVITEYIQFGVLEPEKQK